MIEGNVTAFNNGIMINVSANVMYVKKDCVLNPAIGNCEKGKYLSSIMDDSVIICNEIIDSHEEETKINFNEKDLSVKHKVSILQLHFC